jgi:hypothetical protein
MQKDMTKKINLRNVFIALTAMMMLNSCSKEVLRPDVLLTGDQLTAGRIDGTWASPSNIVTPATVPAEVFGTMRLVFTTDAAGNPSKFIAQNSPIVFTNAMAANWKVTGTAESASVKLTGITPVDDFKVKVSSNTMTVSFFMGWENTDTKETGKGNFKVTLTRQ